jgi:small-conductance mechanosensitive channel
MNRRPAISASAALLLLAALWAHTPAAHAQGGPAAPPPADAVAEEKPAAPAPIPISEVPRRADEQAERLRQVRAAAAQWEPAFEEIRAGLAGLGEDLATDGRVLAETDLLRISPRALGDLRVRWERWKTEVEAWYGTVDGRARRLEGILDELRGSMAVWQATADGAAEGDLPPALEDRISGVLADLDAARGALRATLDTVSTLQNELSDARARIVEVAGRMDAASKAQLWTLDHPPLWTELFGAPGGGAIVDEARKTWRQEREAVEQFLQSKRRRLVGHGVVFLLLVAALRVLGRRARSLEIADDEELEAARRIVTRPLPVALLLCLFPVYWVYPDTPPVIARLILLALLVPLLWLLPLVTPRRLRGGLYGLAAVFVMLKLYQLALHDSLLQRLLLLFVTLAAVLGLLRWIRPRGPARAVKGGPIWRASLAASSLAAVALAASAVSNALGNVALAALLTTATLNASYLWVLLFGMVVVLRGLLAVALRTKPLTGLRSLRAQRDLVKRRGARLLHALAVAFWVWVTLDLWGVREPVFESVRYVLSHPWALGTLTISLGGVLAFFLTLWISVQISRLVRWILGEEVLPRLAVPRGIAGSVSSLVHYAIMAVGFLIAFGAGGIRLDRLTLIIGALGVGIGFGLQNLVNNFVSGLILVFERPIQIGDTVQVGTTLGEVRSIGIRASVVRTFEGAEVIVPNGNLVSTEVVNWTLSDRLRRVEIPVGVAYGTDPERVLALLTETARGDAEVLRHPEPYALFSGFGESSLDFKLRFWTANFDWWVRVASRVTVAVNKAFVEAGIEIPFPQRALHVRSMTWDAQAALAGRGPVTDAPGDETVVSPAEPE